MSLIRKPLLFIENSLIQSKRFRGKINIQKPKPPHFLKAKYLALTKPWFNNPKKDVPIIDLCNKNKQLRDEVSENPFQKILAREALELFESSRLIAFFHANPINGLDQFKAFAMFKKEGMTLKTLGKKTLEMTVKGSQYEAVLSMFVSRTTILFSPEPKIKQMLKINKKFPQLVLLAGIYEGKFVNLDDLNRYSTIPNLETAQSIFVHTLNASASRLNSQLNSHQTRLLNLLEDRKKKIEDV